MQDRIYFTGDHRKRYLCIYVQNSMLTNLNIILTCFTVDMLTLYMSTECKQGPAVAWTGMKGEFVTNTCMDGLRPWEGQAGLGGPPLTVLPAWMD